MDVKLHVFKKDDNRDFRLVQNLTKKENDFNFFMGLRNQLFNASVNIGRDEYFSPVLVPTMSKNIDEQLKLSHKVFDVLDRSYKKICVTLLRYNIDKPESSYVQLQICARKKKNQTF